MQKKLQELLMGTCGSGAKELMEVAHGNGKSRRVSSPCRSSRAY